MGKEAKLRAMRQVLRLGGGLPVSVLPGAPRCSRRCMVLALRREWWRSARRAPLAAELTDAARARLAPPPVPWLARAQAMSEASVVVCWAGD